MIKQKGIVKSLSVKNGGICLITPESKDGVWWNALGDTAKSQITDNLRNTEIELTVVNQENHTFSHVQQIQPKQQPGPANRDRIIVRQNAGSHSAEYVKILVQLGEIETEQEAEKAFFDFAEKFENWVMR